MNSKSSLSQVAKIYGIIITSLMVLIFGTKLIGTLIENGVGQLKEIANATIHWYDDPTGFFLSYLIGYATVWWKPLWGSVIIVVACLLVTVINIDNIGFIIFALLAFIVGILYIASWYDIRKRNKKYA